MRDSAALPAHDFVPFLRRACPGVEKQHRTRSPDGMNQVG